MEYTTQAASKEDKMSKRKTYGEIAYNAALKPYIVRGRVFEWKDTPPSVKAEYQRAANAVLTAYTRRKKYIDTILEAMR